MSGLRASPVAEKRERAQGRGSAALPGRGASRRESTASPGVFLDFSRLRIHARDAVRPEFLRDGPGGDQGGAVAASAQPSSPVLLEGLPVDERYCDCGFEVERNLAWTETMVGLLRECLREVGSEGWEAGRDCKEQKLAERKIRTELAGSVSLDRDIEIEEQPGLCGQIVNRSVLVHEMVHRKFLDRLKERDKTDASAKAYLRNEIDAYQREQPFLRDVQKVLRARCGDAQNRVNNPEYYRQACAGLDFDQGLDIAPDAAFSRPVVLQYLPGLGGKCWWYLDGPGGGYNCWGHCLRGEGEAIDTERSSGSAQDFLACHGYSPSEGTGEIALFLDGNSAHVARRSEHTFNGIQLWESKLGREGPLILHELGDLSGGAYGEFAGYYSRRADAPRDAECK